MNKRQEASFALSALARRALGSTVLLAVAATSAGFPVPKIVCPNCKVREASWTVPDYPEFGAGYSVQSASLDADVSYADSCPLEPVQVPCEHSGTKRVSVSRPGDYTESMPMATGDKATYDVAVTLNLSGPEGPKTYKVPATVAR